MISVLKCWRHFLLIILLLFDFVFVSKGKVAFACEGMRASLLCEQGQVIQIINAKYGRFSSTDCLDGDCTRYQNYHCVSNVTTRVSEICDGRQFCQVHVHSNIFIDPCPRGVFKLAEFTYVCV